MSAALATAAAEAGAPPPALVAEETSAELLATDVDGSVLTRITALVNEAIAGMGKGEETGLTTMNEADVLAAVDQGGGTGGGSGEFWVRTVRAPDSTPPVQLLESAREERKRERDSERWPCASRVPADC